MILQYQQHYTQEVFEVAPFELEVHIFLPFWWIIQHPPGRVWDTGELRFNMPNCIEHCTKLTNTKFFVSLEQSILWHPEARLIGYVVATSTVNNPLDLVTKQFRQFLDIMGKEAANALPEHSAYNYEIQSKEGEKPTWGLICPLSEKELEVLQEYLKEMLKTGKICWSISSAGAPILFVQKPHG